MFGAVMLIGACGYVEFESTSAAESENSPPADSSTVEPTDVQTAELKVLRVVDGDSLEVTIDGVETELRLEGFNAPELYADGGNGTDAKTCNGMAAKAALQSMIESSDEVGLLVGEEDRYGRTLGDIVVDGQVIVPRLIAAGQGFATGGDSPENVAVMEQAAAERLGIWGTDCGDPINDALQIGDVQVDPPGNDRFNLVDEWVEVDNTGSTQVDLDGWMIRDDTTGHRFALEGVIDGGATLRIRSGEGRTSTQDFYLGERYPVWSNGGETVVLVDPNGVFSHWKFVSE